MIHIFDRGNNFVTTIPDPIVASYQKVNRSLWSMKFSLHSDNAAIPKIEPMYFVDLEDDSGEYIGKFRILPTQEVVNQSTNEIEYTCHHAFHTLLDSVIFEEKEFEDVQPSAVMNWLLGRQKIPHWIYVDSPNLPNIEYIRIDKQTGLLESAYDVLEALPVQYYFDFDTTVMPWRVSIKESAAVSSRLKEGYNLDSFEITKDPSVLINRLYLESSYYDDESNKEVLVTLEESNNNVPYLENTELVDIYGPIEWYEKVDGITTSANLKRYGQIMMARMSGLVTTIRGDGYDFLKIMDPPIDIDTLRMGRKVFFETEKHGTYYLYITEESKSDVFGAPHSISITLSLTGDNQTSASVTKSIFSSIKKANQTAQNALISADGKSLITYSSYKPAHGNEGDMWFRKNADGSTDIIIYQNGDWQEEVSKAIFKNLQDQLDTSEEAIKDAKAAADKASEDLAAQVPIIEKNIVDSAASTLQELNDYKVTMETTVEGIQRDINSFDSKFAEVNTSAANNYNELTGKVTDLTKDLSDSIAEVDTTSKNNYNELTGKVTDLTIALADKPDKIYVDQTIDEKTGTITQAIGQIETKVNELDAVPVYTIGADGYWYKDGVKTNTLAVGKDGTSGADGANFTWNLIKNSKTNVVSSNNNATVPITSETLIENDNPFVRIKRKNTTSQPTRMSLYSNFYFNRMDKMYANKRYTFSFEARASHEATATYWSQYKDRVAEEKTTSISSLSTTIANKNMGLTTTWDTFSITFTMPNDTNEKDIIILAPIVTIPEGQIDNFHLDLRNWKLEEGENKNPTWSPHITEIQGEDGADGKDAMFVGATPPTDTSIAWLDTNTNSVKRWRNGAWYDINSEIKTKLNTVVDTVDEHTRQIGVVNTDLANKLETSEFSTFKQEYDSIVSTVQKTETDLSGFKDATTTQLNEQKQTLDANVSKISNIETDLSTGVTFKKIQTIEQTAATNKQTIAAVKKTADGAVQLTAYNTKMSTIDRDISALYKKTDPNDPTSIAYKLNETVKTVDGNKTNIAKVQTDVNKKLDTTEFNTYKQTAEGNFNRISNIETDLSTGTTFKKIQTIEQTAATNKQTIAAVKKTADGAVQLTAYNTKMSTIDSDISALYKKTDPNDPTSIAYKLNETVKTVNGNKTTIAKVEGKIDGMKIGGRNLISLEKIKTNTTNISNAVLVDVKLELVPNTEYIASTSFEQTDYTFDAFFRLPDDLASSGRNGFSDLKPRKLTTGADGIAYISVRKTSPIGQHIQSLLDRTHWVKVEKGNIPTDWTPAPEDLATLSQFNEFKQTAEGNFSRISSIEKDLSTGTTYQKILKAQQTADGASSSIAMVKGDVATINTWKATATSEISKISKIEGDLNSLTIGGRNLVLNTGGKLYTTFGNMATLSEVDGATRLVWKGSNHTSMGEKFSIPLVVGETYTLTFEARGTLASHNFDIYMLVPSGAWLNISSSLNDRVLTQEFKKYTATFEFTGNPSDRLYIGGRGPAGKWLEVKDSTVKLERGNKATDWTPAPEDLLSTSEYNEFKRTTDQTLSVIRNKELIAAINQEAGQVLIQAGTSTTSGKLLINKAGATMENAFIQTAHIANAAITDAKIGSLSANKITTGTLNAELVNVINLDANNITGNKTQFVQSVWNSLSSAVTIDSLGLRLRNATLGWSAYLGASGMEFKDDDTGKPVGVLRATTGTDGRANGVNLTAERGFLAGLGYRNANEELRSMVYVENDLKGNAKLKLNTDLYSLGTSFRLVLDGTDDNKALIISRGTVGSYPSVMLRNPKAPNGTGGTIYLGDDGGVRILSADGKGYKRLND